ncbi:hypothetical protein ACQUZK_09045 [Streptococcus pyogenes]|uniref:hypothetical protein n=1 Tax=Streptococcus pyogenes TaxID=1314 RepID=UPI003DA06987
MSLWESVGDTYVEAAAALLPLHRALSFAVGFVVSFIALDHDYKSVTESLLHLPLDQFATLKEGLFADAVVANLVAGIAAVIAGWLLSRLTLRGMFAVVARATDYEKRVQEAYSTSAATGVSTVGERKEALEFVESILASPQTGLRRLTALAELASALAVTLLAASYWGNLVDIVCGIAALAISSTFHFLAIRLFLADFLGPAILKATLLGKPVPPNLPH